MPPMRNMRRPIGKKKGPSKEELERIAREAEEKRRRQEIFANEADAEKFQLQHDAERDEYDAGAELRHTREREQRELFDQKQTITKLTIKMSQLQTDLEMERGDTDRELSRLRTLLERSHNDLSSTQKETYENDQAMRHDRDRVIELNASLEAQLAKGRANIASLTQRYEHLDDVTSKEIASLRKQLAETNDMANRNEQEHEFRHRHMLREAEKAKVLNASLQEVVAAREADDKKNTTLLQLMNTQLDESKKRQQEFLEDERRRMREVSNELTLLQAKHVSVQEENVLLKQELAHANGDHAKISEALDESRFFTKKWREETTAEIGRVKESLAKDLGDSTQRGVRQANDVVTLRTMLETSNRKVDDLEALLRRKERASSERVAFLNAQIASERAIIQELVDKLREQKKLHEETIAAHGAELRVKQSEIADITKTLLKIQDDARKDREDELRVRQANDAHFRGRVQDLEGALKRQDNLRVASMTNQTEVDVAMAEIARLEALLDEHHIVHQKSLVSSKPKSTTKQQTTAAANKQQKSTTSGGGGGGALVVVGEDDADLRDKNQSLRLKLEKALSDQELQRRISLETEARLQAQVKNQYEVVDALNAELTETRKDLLERCFSLEKQKQELMLQMRNYGAD